MSKMQRRSQGQGQGQGFTMVEIAIVLLIVGLLLGGILKGAELIAGAKVRSVIDQQATIRSAWFAFIDRYDAFPGDFEAEFYVTGATSGDGNGELTASESVLAFQHLALTDLLRCPQCTETANDAFPATTNSPLNNYGGVLSIWNDEHYYATNKPEGEISAQLMLHLGTKLPSNVLAEVDGKIDDGVPNDGQFVYNDFDPTDGDDRMLNGAKDCTRVVGQNGLLVVGELRTPAATQWRPADVDPWANCGAAVII